jgi:hypothetical protein
MYPLINYPSILIILILFHYESKHIFKNNHLFLVIFPLQNLYTYFFHFLYMHLFKDGLIMINIHYHQIL